jgi:general secretion pathway protein I
MEPSKWYIQKMRECKGFTLIEVLLALAIIAISLTALLKATAENVAITTRIKEKMISHWIEMQGMTAVQAGLVTLDRTQDTTQVTQIFHQQWYWRIKVLPTTIPNVQQIQITTSKKHSGPYANPLIGFRYQP